LVDNIERNVYDASEDTRDATKNLAQASKKSTYGTIALPLILGTTGAVIGGPAGAIIGVKVGTLLVPLCLGTVFGASCGFGLGVGLKSSNNKFANKALASLKFQRMENEKLIKVN